MCRRKLAERNSSSLSRVYARVHEENSAVGDVDDDGGGGGGVPPKARRKHPLAIIITRELRETCPSIIVLRKQLQTFLFFLTSTSIQLPK